VKIKAETNIRKPLWKGSREFSGVPRHEVLLTGLQSEDKPPSVLQSVRHVPRPSKQYSKEKSRPWGFWDRLQLDVLKSVRVLFILEIS
jgi:hypothetical protein